MYSSSEEEQSRRKSNLFANTRPKKQATNKLLHSSVNAAPLYQPAANKRPLVKDISFKSSNMSTHTDGSDKLRENLLRFQANKMKLRKDSKESKNSNNLKDLWTKEKFW